MREQTKTNRVLYLDLIRVIASFFVVVWHTDGNLFAVYEETGLGWTYAVINRSIFTCAVISFFMLSGITMTYRKPTIKKTLMNIAKMVAIIIAVSITYYFVLNNNYDFSFLEMLMNIFSTPINVVNWYLYTVIGLYIALPFIYNIVKGLDEKYAIWFMGLYFIIGHYGVFKIIQMIFGFELTSYFDNTFFINNISYLIIGYILYTFLLNKENYNEIRNKVVVITVMGVFIWLLISVMYSMYYKHNFDENVLLSFNLIPAIALFIISEWFCFFVSKFDKYNILNKIVSFIAPLTLWIYVIHNIIKEVIQHPLLNALYALPLPVQKIIFAVTVYAITLVISFIVYKGINIVKSMMLKTSSH